MHNRWAAVAGAAVLALLAIGAWRVADREPATDGQQAAPTTASPSVTTGAVTPQASTPQPDPTAPASPDEPGGAEPTGADSPSAPVPSPLPETVAPPTPSPGLPPVDAPALAGTALITDPADDLADSAGLPPDTPVPAVELTSVRLRGDGETLEVQFLAAGDVPAEAGSLVWSLDIWLEDALAYTITVQQVGARVVSGVLDWRSSEQQPPPVPPLVRGSSVTVRVPHALLPDIDGPFQWQALGQSDGGFEDYVPEDGRLTWFPES